MKCLSWPTVIVLVGIIAIVGTLLIALDRVPAPWWDEGWTMAAARNWIERGHYGQWLIDQPMPSGLSAAFPTVASVAVGFKILGVGVGQARLVIVLYTVATLVVWLALMCKLYSRRLAVAALIVLLFFAPDAALNPIIVGRQVLAEMPMMFFLLIGYTGLWLTLRRSAWWLLLAIPVWGFALITKAQALPFWAVSLALPLLIMAVRHQWKVVAVLTTALLGSCALSLLWPRAIDLVAPGYSAGVTIEGLVEVTALVLIPQVRLTMLRLIAQIGLPTLIGLIYVAVRWIRRRESSPLDIDVMRLSLWSFAASWFTWYALLSRGSTRYVFPAVFVGSTFVAVLLRDVTDGFRLTATLDRLARSIKQRRIDQRAMGCVVMLALMLSMLISSLHWVAPFAAALASSENSVKDVTDYLTSRTAPDALIETYDSELFVVLNRRYHFPPDSINVDLIRDVTNANLGIEASTPIAINYNPLTANPDYVVVGPADELWRRLYDPVLATGVFRQVYANRTYEVYERVR